jgi:hypothetical protein
MVIAFAGASGVRGPRHLCVLKTKGIDPAQTFLDRQAHQMRCLPPW